MLMLVVVSVRERRVLDASKARLDVSFAQPAI